MARPQLSDALGREAVYQRPRTDQPTKSTRAEVVPSKQAKPRWDELNVRATYHLPRTLIDAIAAEATRSGRSKAQVVSDALRRYLVEDGP